MYTLDVIAPNRPTDTAFSSQAYWWRYEAVWRGDAMWAGLSAKPCNSQGVIGAGRARLGLGRLRSTVGVIILWTAADE